MLTRCPECETTFRVTPEQIKVRGGRVRCGACQHVFNALDTLIEEPMMVVATPSSEPAELHTALAPDIPEPAVEIDAPPEQENTPLDTTLVESTPPLPVPESEPVVEVPSEPKPEPALIAEEPEPLPEFLSEETSHPPRRWPWIFGGLIALGTMVCQLALAFRVELAVLLPNSKPALAALCGIAGCEVGLPKKVELVSIETSDLHPDTETKGQLALTATLKNRAPFAQEFPLLELTLTDTADKAIARRVLPPVDYLPPKTKPARGMPANADLAITVSIDPKDLPASGYRLYLFYP